MPRAIGIDIGGTKIAGGLVDLATGAILDRREKPTEAIRGGSAILEDVISLIQTVRADAAAIGVGIAELVDRDGKIASNATIDWLKTPVRERLSEILPTHFEADVRAAARAEARFGAGAGSEIFLYVTVGTGISCCLIQNGKPYLGARGLTGTFASARNVFAAADGMLSNSPPLEDFSAGPALARRAGTLGDARKVVALAGMGNSLAREVVRSGGYALGAAIAQLVNTLDPERVVIGGGLGCAFGLFYDSLRDAFYKHLWSELHANIPLTQAKLGPDAGIIGAALATVT
jgi:predicted NBD/HSP70 family sugar kinase